MRIPGPHLRRMLLAVAILVLFPAVDWFGYQAGYAAQKPDPWAIVLVRRNPKGSISGNSYSWYDRNNPAQERDLHAEEARLKFINADFYLAKGRFESTLSPEHDPRHASSHR